MHIFIRKALSPIYHKSPDLQYYWNKRRWKQRDALSYLTDKEFAVQHYKNRTGRALDIDNPKTFDEKIWYLKINYRDPQITICADKYRVREYVEQCGLGHILNELYGVFNSADEIDFNKIPSPCFLKCNHVSGTNAFYDRDKPFNVRHFKRHFNFMLSQNYYLGSREWGYKNIPPKIVCERVMLDKDGNRPKEDYKFLCFNGEPKILFYETGICAENGEHTGKGSRDILDMQFNKVQFWVKVIEPFDKTDAQRPENFDQMVEYARTLASPFPFCRVDLNNLNGRIYFGEITFYPWGGCHTFEPKEWAMILGDWIDISGVDPI